MTIVPVWLETVRTLWDTFKISSGREFEKLCEKSLLYLYTVKGSDIYEENLIEDLRDILFESENSKQVSFYLAAEEEKERLRYYLAITGKTLSMNVKLKRAIYAKRLDAFE